MMWCVHDRTMVILHLHILLKVMRDAIDFTWILIALLLIRLLCFAFVFSHMRNVIRDILFFMFICDAQLCSVAWMEA